MKIIEKTFLILLFGTTSFAVADEDESNINNEAKIRTTIVFEQRFATNVCKAELEIEYYQKGSSVHVESTLTNADCGASSGSYVIQVRYRGADRQTRSKEFAELWERTDITPVLDVKDYYIADDVDIIRVRSRKLDCSCAPEATKNND